MANLSPTGRGSLQTLLGLASYSLAPILLLQVSEKGSFWDGSLSVLRLAVEHPKGGDHGF